MHILNVLRDFSVTFAVMNLLKVMLKLMIVKNNAMKLIKLQVTWKKILDISSNALMIKKNKSSI